MATAVAYPSNRAFQRKIANFPEYYTFGDYDHLTYLMRVLVGDAGTGQFLKIISAARLAESLAGTLYSELDAMFGVFLALPRMPSEIYSYDPFTDQLTVVQWNEVNSKDASYRQRISQLLKAFNRGGTPSGIALAAQAASGQPCLVVEGWRWTDAMGVSGTVGSSIGRFSNNPRELVILPKIGTTALTTDQVRAIYITCGRIAPRNAIITVNSAGLAIYSQVAVNKAVSPYEYFEVQKFVTGVDVPPAPDGSRYYWLENGVEQEAPSFSGLQSLETSFQQNNSVSSVTSSVVGAPSAVNPNAPASPDPINVTVGLNGSIPSGQIAYVVTAVSSAGGESIPSQEVVRIVAPQNPDVPYASAQITWTAVAGADLGYKVYGRTQGLEGLLYAVAPGITSWIDNGSRPPGAVPPSPVVPAATSLADSVQAGSAQWGPWRQVDLADSPDNYPNGKYPGDPAKRGANGSYLFAWPNQAAYVAWLQQAVIAAGGEFDVDKYRLPVTAFTTPTSTSTPNDSLAPNQVIVQSMVFGR